MGINYHVIKGRNAKPTRHRSNAMGTAWVCACVFYGVYGARHVDARVGVYGYAQRVCVVCVLCECVAQT